MTYRALNFASMLRVEEGTSLSLMNSPPCCGLWPHATLTLHLPFEKSGYTGLKPIDPSIFYPCSYNNMEFGMEFGMCAVSYTTVDPDQYTCSD